MRYLPFITSFQYGYCFTSLQKTRRPRRETIQAALPMFSSASAETYQNPHFFTTLKSTEAPICLQDLLMMPKKKSRYTEANSIEDKYPHYISKDKPEEQLPTIGVKIVIFTSFCCLCIIAARKKKLILNIGKGGEILVDLILASDPSLTPVHSFPTQYEPPVHFPPLSSSMSFLSALCTYIPSAPSVHSYASRHAS